MAAEPTNPDVLAALSEAFKSRIPSGARIIDRAIDNCLAGHENDNAWIKEHFSDLIDRTQAEGYAEYLRAESEAGAFAMRATFTPLVGASGSAESLLDVLGIHFWALDKFFLSLTQGRKPRAGKAFETALKRLFIKLEYPFSPQAAIDGQPDFLLPSIEHYKRNAMDCIIFTAKRTLRERWRQIVTEGSRGLGFFLATIDEEVAVSQLVEMLHHRIYLVVPGALKANIEHYKAAPNVISFEEFFRFYLDPAMERWKASGALAGWKRV
jgi:hypothetical protein